MNGLRLFAAIGLGAIVLAAQGAALAQETAKPAEMKNAEKAEMRESRYARHFIRIFDTDGNGSVSVAEIQAEQRRILAASDVDADGTLSVEEFRRRGRLIQSLGTTTLFDLLDTNGDAKISTDELAAPSARWFKRYDADGDGAMTAEELPARHHDGRKGYRGRKHR